MLKMGGKIPRNIKVKVIRQWLDGRTRERIAKKEDIGAGGNEVEGRCNRIRCQKEQFDKTAVLVYKGTG
jgi:hypothetical protein